MKNSKLAELNFQKLLHYGGEPTDQASLPERNCPGYCVSCEEKGLLVNGDVKLDQMSHGADTDDFERVIRRLDPGGVDFPIAFLLESPGGYYVNGKQIDYKEARKQPPVFCYYWLPKGLTDWPTDPEEVKPSTYGLQLLGDVFFQLHRVGGEVRMPSASFSVAMALSLSIQRNVFSSTAILVSFGSLQVSGESLRGTGSVLFSFLPATPG
jgi:hypothetical protein